MILKGYLNEFGEVQGEMDMLEDVDDEVDACLSLDMRGTGRGEELVWFRRELLAGLAPVVGLARMTGREEMVALLVGDLQFLFDNFGLFGCCGDLLAAAKFWELVCWLFGWWWAVEEVLLAERGCPWPPLALFFGGLVGDLSPAAGKL